MLAGFQDVTFEFGARAIVRDTTWHIQPNERIGLIGYNGTGKSTLLKVLTGEYQPSKGTVERSRGTTIGYLHQDLLGFDTSESILEVALGAFEAVRQLEKEIETMATELENSSDEALLMKYADKLHDLEMLGGYTIHHQTEEVLHGLGFSQADLARPYRQFSGGWRMRVLLAKMILQQPDLLLLDEPTNHLDLPSIEWLERYLQTYKGAVVIVSHDKYFLNRMVTKIVELYQQQLHFYTGNYDYYQEEKELRMELQQRAYENQQDYIRQQERFIERFRAKSSKAAAAQSAIKRLEKLDRVEDVMVDRPEIRINFQLDKTPGKVLCTLKNVTKQFGALKIVDHADAEINRGDKIALIGANGKGKSTLLRIIAGTENFEGERVWGHNVEESFYAQHQLEALNLSHTILEEMKAGASQKTEQELRNLLGGFLFGGEDVDKKIKVLSGGEKARVALAKTIVSKANFLMLDEPTNHLDLLSIDLLIDALNQYEGSYILVSHDRHFISRTANKIWEIEDCKIKEFAGGYEEWIQWKDRMTRSGLVREKEKPRQEEKPVVTKPQPVVQAAKPIDRELKKDLQKYQKKFKELEEKMSKLNEEKQRLEAELASPGIYTEKDHFSKVERRYKELGELLSACNTEYESVFEKVMELEAQAKQ